MRETHYLANLEQHPLLVKAVFSDTYSVTIPREHFHYHTGTALCLGTDPLANGFSKRVSIQIRSSWESDDDITGLSID